MQQRRETWLAGKSRAVPTATALVYGGSCLSFVTLNDRVLALCNRLEQAQVGKGSAVAMSSGSGLLTVLMLHAAQRLGFTLFPLRPDLQRLNRERLLTQAGVGYQVVDATGPAADAVTGVPPFLVKANEESRGGAYNVVSKTPYVWLLVATSGSSGEPKAVMLSEQNLAASIIGANQCLGLAANDCWLLCLPLFHIGGLAVLLRCVEAGAAVVLHERFDPVRVLQDMQAHRVTHVSLVPAMLAKLLEVNGNRPAPPDLRVVLTGGGPISPLLAKRAHHAGWPLCVTYGMSETASQLATDCSERSGSIHGRVGRPLSGVKLRCTGSSQHAPGRIWVSGKMVMEGYANPMRMPGAGVEKGWFETGDLGYLEADGVLYLLGRADDLLVSGGETIHPVEVENRLRTCPGIDAVLASSRWDAVWGERLVAIYEGAITEMEAEHRVRAYLNGVYRPREFILVDSLPVDDRDKPDRKRLKQWLAAG